MPGITFIIGTIASSFNLFGIGNFCLAGKYILGKVYQDRAFSACASQIKSFFKNAGKIRGIFYQIVMFSYRIGNPCYVSLLEGIVTNHSCGNLTGKSHHGDRIHTSGSDSRNQISSPRTRGSNTDPYLPRSSSISIGRMSSSLFMAGKDVFYLVGFVNNIVQRNYRASRIPEDNLHSFLHQGFQYDLGSASLQFLPLLGNSCHYRLFSFLIFHSSTCISFHSHRDKADSVPLLSPFFGKDFLVEENELLRCRDHLP
ncbi:hypothetical protein ES703_89502 [subsurface metagenome]